MLDLCSGSGTLAEACINTNRDFIIIEKNPNDYEVGKERVGKIFKNYGLNAEHLIEAPTEQLIIPRVSGQSEQLICRNCWKPAYFENGYVICDNDGCGTIYEAY